MPGFERWSDTERKEVNDVLQTGILMRYGFDGLRNGVRGYQAVGVNGQYGDVKTVAFEGTAWVEHRVVLHCGRHEVAAAVRGGREHASQCEAV